MIKWIKNFFQIVTPMTEIETRDAYFAEAKDLCDLERRMRAWDKTSTNQNLRGWI
jgi:hypothetical protein